MKPLTLITVLLLLAGCAASRGGMVTAAHPGEAADTSLSMGTAKLDAATSLGLYWNSNIRSGEILLTVSIDGYETIQPGSSLRFTVDGTTYRLISSDPGTLHETVATGDVRQVNDTPVQFRSSRRYLISSELAAGILASKRTVWALDLDAGTREGVFPTDGRSGMADTGFREFLGHMGNAWKK